MKIGKPLVSIIIPVFNKVAFLEASVNSALESDWDAKEIIIVEDCSTDGSYNLANQLQQQFPEKIQVVATPINQGPGAARNLGIKLANGEWVAFLDADDRLSPMVFQQARAYLDNPHIDGVFGMANMEFDEPQEQERWGARPLCWPMYEKTEPEHVLGTALMKGKGLWATDALVVKKDIFIKSGMFNESCRVGEDRDLWLRMLLTANLVPSTSCDPWVTVRRTTDSAWRVHVLDDRIRDVLGNLNAHSWGKKNLWKVKNNRLDTLEKAMLFQFDQALRMLRERKETRRLVSLATRVFFKNPGLFSNRLVMGNLLYGLLGK